MSREVKVDLEGVRGKGKCDQSALYEILNDVWKWYLQKKNEDKGQKISNSVGQYLLGNDKDKIEKKTSWKEEWIKERKEKELVRQKIMEKKERIKDKTLQETEISESNEIFLISSHN